MKKQNILFDFIYFGFGIVISGLIFSINNSSVSVLFPPDDNARIAIVQDIKSAKNTIHLEAYSFTNSDLFDSLIQAKQSGKDVALIIDADYSKNNEMVHRLAASGIQVWMDHKHPIMHSKVLIIDNKIVFTGSSNLTKAGLEPNGNGENSLRIVDKTLAEQYEKNWQQHRQHSQELKS